MKVPGPTEKQFLAQVKDLARLFGWKCYHTWNSLHSAKGFPDLVLLRPPQLIFCELKGEKGKVSPEQSEWQIELNSVPGIHAFVFRPSDWDRLVKLLEFVRG